MFGAGVHWNHFGTRYMYSDNFALLAFNYNSVALNTSVYIFIISLFHIRYVIMFFTLFHILYSPIVYIFFPGFVVNIFIHSIHFLAALSCALYSPVVYIFCLFKVVVVVSTPIHHDFCLLTLLSCALPLRVKVLPPCFICNYL